MSGTGRDLPARGAPLLLVIFDCDGVLVDSERISNGVLAQMLGELGWTLSVEEARATFQGLTLPQVAEIAERSLGAPLPEGWIELYVRRRAALFEAELQPVPGAAELVARVAAAGIGVCVASQGSLEKTARSLALTGLAPLFGEDARFSASQVAQGKPAPDLFLYAAAGFGVPPCACAVIEDTATGVLAAVRAGMTAYGLTADSDEGALREAGAITAPTLREAGDLLLGGVDNLKT